MLVPRSKEDPGEKMTPGLRSRRSRTGDRLRPPQNTGRQALIESSRVYDLSAAAIMLIGVRITGPPAAQHDDQMDEAKRGNGEATTQHRP